MESRTRWIESWVTTLQKLNPGAALCIISDNSIGYLGNPDTVRCPKGYSVVHEYGFERSIHPNGPEIIGVSKDWK